MNNQNVRSEIYEILKELTEFDHWRMTTDTKLIDVGVDSLDVWEIALKIEERFKIDIEDGVPEAWVTVQDVIDSVLNEIGPTSENIADVLKDHCGFEETPALAEMRNYCNEKLTPEQYEKERTFIPQQGDFVNVTIHSNGKVDVKPGTPPAINRIERADVKTFAAGLRDHEIMGEANAIDYYQRIATKSAIYPGKGTPFGLMYAALGLAEAGEVQNKVKKAFRDDGVIEFEFTRAEDAQYPDDPASRNDAHVSFRPLSDERRAQIIKELGGALWYIAAVCNEIGATMSEVALQNLDELCGRGERDTLRGDGDNR